MTYGRPGLVLVRGVATDGGIPEFATVPTDSGSIPPLAPEPVAPIRVELLDMPLMIESHDATAPSFYLAACPLGGGRLRGASLFQPTADGLDYTVAAVASLPSIIGSTVTALGPGPAWRWDALNSFEVQLDHGTLQSLSDERVLGGANAALIGDEILQFTTAELIAPGRYRLSRILRGQRGTEHEIAEHPAGSRFVLLDPSRQPRPTFSVARIGTSVGWRVAPGPQGPSGDLAQEITFTNTGRGLRPFSPVHLRAVREQPSGDVRLSWIRRTRLGGDSWVADVPLGEEVEDYAVTIMNGATKVRSIRAGAPEALYTAVEQTADFGALPSSLTWTVAQVSRVYGAGVPAPANTAL